MTGAGGATIHVTSGTVGDGSGSNYYLCQERVAVHEAFESVTDVSAADCCTGQTPGNLCDQCSSSCSVNWSNTAGPAGYGSNYITCNGVNYVSQKVEPWISQSDEWLPQYCEGAVAKSTTPPPCGCYSGNGDYCGSSANSYAASHQCSVPSLNNGYLYNCNNGTFSLKQACTNGCTYNQTGADTCTLPPCGCYANDGTYCGSNANAWASQHGCSLPWSFSSGYLYSCYGGTWSLAESCANGCTYNSTGGDYCTAPSSCGGVVCGGNCCAAGDWCGTGDKCCSACGTGCPC